MIGDIVGVVVEMVHVDGGVINWRVGMRQHRFEAGAEHISDTGVVIGAGDFETKAVEVGRGVSEVDVFFTEGIKQVVGNDGVDPRCFLGVREVEGDTFVVFARSHHDEA